MRFWRQDNLRSSELIRACKHTGCSPSASDNAVGTKIVVLDAGDGIGNQICAGRKKADHLMIACEIYRFLQSLGGIFSTGRVSEKRLAGNIDQPQLSQHLITQFNRDFQRNTVRERLQDRRSRVWNISLRHTQLFRSHRPSGSAYRYRKLNKQ